MGGVKYGIDMQLYTVFCTSRAHLASAPNRPETHQLYTPLVIAECRLHGLEFPIEGIEELYLPHTPLTQRILRPKYL